MPEDKKKPEPVSNGDGTEEVKPDPRLVSYMQEGWAEATEKKKADGAKRQTNCKDSQ